MITEFLNRLRFLFFPKRRSEVDDELEFHLEQSVAAKTAEGLPALEARRQALIEFGGVEAARERCAEQRPGWWLGFIAQDARYALRGILAHRWFSAAIIATLALGIGLNTMVFTLVNAALFKPVPVPGGARLVSVLSRNLSHDDGGQPFSYPDFQDYRSQANSFESFEASMNDGGIVSESGIPPQQYPLQHSTPGIFSMTTARLLLPSSRYKDSDARQRFFDRLLPRLRAIPGVSHAAIASDAPGIGENNQQIELEHQPIANPADRAWIMLVAASPGYFDTIRLPILRGRGFDPLDGAPHHQAAVLTREAAARLWPGEDPIGKRFRLFDDGSKPTDWITVVGISADMVQAIRENDPHPLLFVPYRQEGWDDMALLVESVPDPVAPMRAAVASLDPELPLAQPSRLNKAVEFQAWFVLLFGKIFLGFALIAMLMASVGIYAIIAHTASSRTQEIGVRIALGATMRNILLLVMTRGLWQITVGLVLGLAGALPLGHLMASLPLGVSPSGPYIPVAVGLTLAFVGAFACWLPARRATALDPVKAIRYE